MQITISIIPVNLLMVDDHELLLLLKYLDLLPI